MYPKFLLSLICINFFFFGCSGKSYPVQEEKKKFPIQESRLPSSVYETAGRYRKDF